MIHVIIYVGIGGVALFFGWLVWCLISVLLDPQQLGREGRRARAAGDQLDRLFNEAHRRANEEAARYRRRL